MDKQSFIKIVECPRDAMQGIRDYIPAQQKAGYINILLKVGFDTIDFGSFVSPAAVPQMRDTAEVLAQLDLASSSSKLLAIVANERGASDACRYDEISCIGYPFSVSETFQLRNTNATIEKSFEVLQSIRDMTAARKKELVVYLSMAFGNPYGDAWNADIVTSWAARIGQLGVDTLALADTVGLATADDVRLIYSEVKKNIPSLETGVHLHCRPDNWKDKVNAAYECGCSRFDAAIRGLGGCPMANDELVGNLATENLLDFLNSKNVVTAIDKIRFNEAIGHANQLFQTKFAV